MTLLALLVRHKRFPVRSIVLRASACKCMARQAAQSGRFASKPDSNVEVIATGIDRPHFRPARHPGQGTAMFHERGKQLPIMLWRRRCAWNGNRMDTVPKHCCTLILRKTQDNR